MVSGVIQRRSGRTIALKSSSRWMGAVFALDKNYHSNVSTQPGRIARRYLDQRLRLSLLRAVDAVETHRSLLKASTVLGITQPALTKSLQELEDILQTRLFHRHSRGVRPTDAGLVFVQTARRILAEVRRLDDALDQLSSPGGTLALGALPVTAAGVLPGALIRLKATYPASPGRSRGWGTGSLQLGRTSSLRGATVPGRS